MPSYNAGASGASSILPDGEYPFSVKACKLKTSSNGNEMFELILEFPMNCTVFDNLVFTDSSAWKIDQFRESIGHLIIPGKINLNASDFIGQRGKAVLRIETWEGKKRNKIEAYVPADVKKAFDKVKEAAAKAGREPEPDDIPY